MSATARTFSPGHETGPPQLLTPVPEHPVLRIVRRISVSRHVQPALLAMRDWVSFELTDPVLLPTAAQRAALAVFKEGCRLGVDVLAWTDEQLADAFTRHFNFSVGAAVIAQAIHSGRRDEMFQSPILHAIARQHFEATRSASHALDAVFAQWAQPASTAPAASICEETAFQVALGEAMRLAEAVAEDELLPRLVSAERLIRGFQLTLGEVPQSGALSSIQEQDRKLGRHAVEAYHQTLGEGGEAWIGALNAKALRMPAGSVDLQACARSSVLKYLASIEQELKPQARSLFDTLFLSNDMRSEPAVQDIPTAQRHRLMSEINRATMKVLDRMTLGQQDGLIDALSELMPPIADQLHATLKKRRGRNASVVQPPR